MVIDAPIVAPIVQVRRAAERLKASVAVGEAARFIWARAVSLFLGSLLLNAVPAVALQWFGPDFPRRTGFWGDLRNLTFNLLSSGILGAVLLAWVALAMAEDLKGSRQGSPFANVGRVISLVPQLVVNAVVFWMGVEALAFLLVIPGALAGLAWSMAAPVIAVEALGPFRALHRSALLTRGNRWMILGLGAPLILGQGALQLLLQPLTDKVAVPFVGQTFSVWTLFVYPLIQTLGGVLTAVLLSAIYLQLSRVGERSTIPAVFD